MKRSGSDSSGGGGGGGGFVRNVTITDPNHNVTAANIGERLKWNSASRASWTLDAAYPADGETQFIAVGAGMILLTPEAPATMRSMSDQIGAEHNGTALTDGIIGISCLSNSDGATAEFVLWGPTDYLT